MKNLIYFLFLSVVLFVSCHKEDSTILLTNNADKIENKPYAEQVEYAKQHLLQIGKVVSKLYQNAEFRNNLKNDLVAKDDKTETTILISDLISGENSRKYTSISNEDKLILNNEINAFKDIEGQDWQPQIYLPNFNDQQKTLDATKPIIIPFVVEEEDETYEGYQEDNYGDLKLIDTEITEEFAEDYNNVVIISLNETLMMPNSQDMPPMDINSIVNEKHSIEYFTAKVHNESWVAGASEVAIRGVQCKYNGEVFSGVNSSYNYLGKEIKKVSRSDVRNKVRQYISTWGVRYYEDLTYNNIFSDSYLYNNEKVLSCNVIFESDAWPTGTRDAIFYVPSNNSTVSVTYRSSHQQYAAKPLYFKKLLTNETLLDNYYENTGDFEFKLFKDNGYWSY